MTNRFKFTQDRIKKLSPPTVGRDTYHNIEKPKLTLRVTPTGRKTFQVLKKTSDGKTHRVTLGCFPDISVSQAEKLTDKVLSDLSEGKDVNATKRQTKAASTSLESILEKYIESRTLKPGTVADYRKKFRQGFSDWKDRSVSSITPGMVLKRQQKISKSGQTLANTTMRVLRAILKFAKAIGAVDIVATDILSETRVWHPNKRKTRIIPSDKLSDWYSAVLAYEHPKPRIYLLTLLHTGLRRTEAETLRWSDVGFTEMTLTARDTKNKTDHKQPIPDALLPHLMALNGISGSSEWVFPNNTNSGPMSTPSKHIARIASISDVPFSAHDCRRTFATIGTAVGLPEIIIKKLLNHTTDNDVTGGYIQTETSTLRGAINQIGKYIICKTKTNGNVVQITNHSG